MKNILLKARGVTKKYKEDLILDHVDLDVYHGDFTVIMGESGAGKSTLLYMLSGMDEMNEGSVRFKEYDLEQCNESRMSQLRSKYFGFVFQQANLINHLTIEENVLVAGMNAKRMKENEVRKKTNTLLERLGLQEVKDHLPSEVSGGEAQRASFARALINDPELVFCDEPTGALNRKNTMQVLDLCSFLHQNGQSILMVSHDIQAALRGDRIIYLDDGKIVDELVLSPYRPDEMQLRESIITDWLQSLRW